MKISIIYYSMTGHSKKMANAISKELNVSSENIKTNPKLEDVDLLYIISGIYGDKSSPVLIEYVKELTKRNAKKAALITSSGSGTTKPIEVREILENNGIMVLKDEFLYSGGFMFFGGHPNKKDIMNATNFVRETLKTL
ncbi:MAG: flavodoxin domain-containing protein [Bacilli bacterium]|nr:flavodoxin domain-containing protein [Bacilli bacterium]MDD3896006.1 flavodoxin domain-containing protein [Bacilli bacterium]MDD4407928.1 flavodoxin domain-containing protein [Bacilli bacterium]